MVKFSADVAQKMQEVNFSVKNTFIDIDSVDDDLKVSLAGRQSSEPARPLKGILAEPFKVGKQDALVDPAGPEPEPDTRAASRKSEEKEEDTLTVKWDRLGTGERWSNEEEAEQPEQQEVQMPWSPSPCFEAQAQPLAGMPCGSGYPYAHGMPWAMPYSADGYAMVAMPGPVGMSQVPAYTAQPNPSKASASQDTQKRRRRRAGSSLIDLAKKRMAERCAEEGGALTLAPVCAGPPAPASGGGEVQSFCANCDRAFGAAFKFCYECGQPLQPRLQ